MRALTLTALACIALTGCGDPPPDLKLSVAGGDRTKAPELIRQYGCGACHTIPGVPGANASVGPSLKGLRDRPYVAGVLANNAENLVRWIQHPREVDPKTAMPETGISEEGARHIAAYLYAAR